MKFRWRLSKNVQSLLFLAWFLIPFIPVVLLWGWLNPVGFWQSLVMFFVCAVLYGVCLVVEFGLAWLFGDML